MSDESGPVNHGPQKACEPWTPETCSFGALTDLHVFYVSCIALLMGLLSFTSKCSSPAQAAWCLVAEHYVQLSTSHCSFGTSLVAFLGNLFPLQNCVSKQLVTSLTPSYSKDLGITASSHLRQKPGLTASDRKEHFTLHSETFFKVALAFQMLLICHLFNLKQLNISVKHNSTLISRLLNLR